MADTRDRDMKEKRWITEEGDLIPILLREKALKEDIRIADHTTRTTKTTIKATTNITKESNYPHSLTKRVTKTSLTPDPSAHLTKNKKPNRNTSSAAKKKLLTNKITSH